MSGLPICWSQGATEQEALENIQDAIAEYLAAIDALVKVRKFVRLVLRVNRAKDSGVNHLEAVRALEKQAFESSVKESTS